MEDNKNLQSEELENVQNETADSVENETAETQETNAVEEKNEVEINDQEPQPVEEPKIQEEVFSDADEKFVTEEESVVEEVEPSEKPVEEEEIAKEVVAEKQESLEETTEDPVREQEAIDELVVEEKTVVDSEEALEIPVEEELVEHTDLVLEDNSEDVSAEVAENFNKELHSAKDHKHAEEENEEEVIPDYQTYEVAALIDELEKLIEDNPFDKIKGRVASIKLAFLAHEKAAKEEFLANQEKTEEAEAFVYPFTDRFNAVFNCYRQKKIRYMEDLEKEKEVNLEKKQHILEELKALLMSGQTLKVTYDRFRELQEEWKNIGMVPKQEIATLWNNYHFLIEKFFDKVRIHRELKELDLKKNLEQKISLCEKAEELLLEEKISEAFRKLQTYHKQWKEIGTVPDDSREEIWERFKLASDTINQRHRDHCENIYAEYEGNVQAKIAICEKVEEICAEQYESIGEWNRKAGELSELFKLWKSVGPISKVQNDELWERYRKSMGMFYKAKKRFFGKIREMHMDNYNKKLNLCLEAEALQGSTDWKNTPREFIRLQKEWKSIGAVPTKLSDTIWNRFRAACNHFFNNKKEHFNSRSAVEPENLKAKKALIEELKDYAFTQSKAENLDKLKEFQRRWLEIGFVPIKEKERLQTEYRKVLSEKMKKLNISSFEVSSGGEFRYYRGAGGQESGSADERGLRKEISFLQNKINAMQDEINLWENNLGFLASSKNADILKQEFEKKIQREKNELELNIAKLRFLRQELTKEDDEKKSKE
ncbi:MAG: DUF349 domain-containing protein [Bacteroidales bacterium]|jgi:hypothetical protein|nr:DUF349 domain-containing protein [Bacteroidales bacterium]